MNAAAPTVYTKDQHGITLDQIDKNALFVMEKLQSKGYDAYLVGGGVRDLLLGYKPKDFDIATSALPEEVKACFSRCFLIGRRFRLAHVRFGHKIIEVATFRSGSNEEDSLITHDNTWGSPEEDALRRDFTINGLFYNSKDETIIDFVKGFEAIQKKELKVIGIPYLRFKQDPVRMIRMVKFEARFGLSIEKEAHMALLDCRKELLKSSQARLFEEIFRMLESGTSRRFFTLLVQYELLAPMLPFLSQFLQTPHADGFYAYLKLIDIMTVQDRPLDRSLILAAILYPMLEVHIMHISRGEKNVSLSEVHKIATKLIFDFFHPFFLVPRKMRQTACFILVYQLRLTPIKVSGRKKMRIPQSPDFSLALSFLKMRSVINPELGQAYEKWVDLHETFKTKKKKKKTSSPDRTD